MNLPELPFQNPSAHLARAKALLEDSKPESIFYAALEFRYAVEGRLHQYSEKAELIQKKKKGIWRIKDVAQQVNGAFQIQRHLYVINVTHQVTGKSVELRFTPVPDEVITFAGKIDNFLHVGGLYQTVKEGRERLRGLLREGIVQLEKAISGGLLSPALNKPNGDFEITLDLHKHPEFIQNFSMNDAVNVTIRIETLPLDTGKAITPQPAA